MYAEPRPTVELIVPNGYRGVIKAEVQVQEETPGPPHQRSFSYAVPASGIVQVPGPPLFGHLAPADFCRRYADGTALSRDAKEPEPGFWWLTYDGQYQHFLVGMRSEFDALRHDYDKKGEAEHRSSGGKGGGKGRRNRGGGQAPADSSSGGM